MNWFTILWERLLSETPSFFKKIIYFGVTLGAIGGCLIGLKSQGVDLPEWLSRNVDNMIIIGAVSAIVAKSAVKDPEKLSQ